MQSTKMKILPEAEIIPTDLEIIPRSDASDISDPLAEEKEEYDDTTYHHDEVGLNPIEDKEVLEKILKAQNNGCCDTAIEKSLVEMKIPEEVIEDILCRADKRLCTCETTAWMDRATGYNYCGADDSIVVLDEDGKGADGSCLDSVMENEESTVADAKESLTEKDESVDSVNDEDRKDNSLAFDESVALATTGDNVEASKVKEDSELGASLANDEKLALAIANDAVEAAMITDESNMDTASANNEDVVLATTDDAIEAENIADENNSDTALVTTDDADEEAKITDEINVDTELANDENVSVISMEMPELLLYNTLEKNDDEKGFECVLDSTAVGKENAENEQFVAFSPKKKNRKFSKRISSKISRIMFGNRNGNGKLKLRNSLSDF